MEKNTFQQCEQASANIRTTIIEFASVARFAAHWGGSLSCVEILSTLYGSVMNCRDWALPHEKRDKFLLSKGHAAMALYATLAEVGLIAKASLASFQQDGSYMAELAICNEGLRVEHSGGSLGLGLPLGVGLVFAAKKRGYTYNTYVLAGDGECDEGSIWESVMLAGQLKLDNLFFIVDYNKMQGDYLCSDVISMDNLKQRVETFGWEAVYIDGNNCEALLDAFGSFEKNGKPKAIIADTVKGKGISFMEGDNSWHHRLLNKELLEQARLEVGLA